MSFQVSKDIRRFAYEDSQTIGRDILFRRLIGFADKVDETIDDIIAYYNRRIAKQAGVMAETADRNVKQKEINKELVDENCALCAKLKVAEDALEKASDASRFCIEQCELELGPKMIGKLCDDGKACERALAEIREEGEV